MYYVNSFFLYSVFGFIMESFLFKTLGEWRFSGVLFGPITIVYGLGGLAIVLISKYIFPYLKKNMVLGFVITFVLCTIILTLIEGISGYLCELIFGTVMWDYSSKSLNIGKYICLEMAPLWGMLGTIVIIYLKPFFDRVVSGISKECTYFLVFIFNLDILLTLIYK